MMQRKSPAEVFKEAASNSMAKSKADSPMSEVSVKQKKSQCPGYIPPSQKLVEAQMAWVAAQKAVNEREGRSEKMKLDKPKPRKDFSSHMDDPDFWETEPETRDTIYSAILASKARERAKKAKAEAAAAAANLIEERAKNKEDIEMKKVSDVFI